MFDRLMDIFDNMFGGYASLPKARWGASNIPPEYWEAQRQENMRLTKLMEDLSTNNTDNGAGFRAWVSLLRDMRNG